MDVGPQLPVTEHEEDEEDFVDVARSEEEPDELDALDAVQVKRRVEASAVAAFREGTSRIGRGVHKFCEKVPLIFENE